ncbi:guanine nucleotide exchange factor VAV2-like isoform X3 [Dreissena polymorpha]|uniref:guanine nucleotide exchange factor VAV2-like isoform X3 n=1 Tax=Dreissena polymorpha TaxID=45954 RepID=UPI002264EB11|nr:guanine nucleotide exchange factor VAV2-like isoform X3 [Dreissena polymorpha]
MAEEWQLCVDWLLNCGILRPEHKATQPGAVVFDLVQALRDGVLLCHLLNSLKPYCVDSKDFSPRPQLSQFLCTKNIRAFLQTCEKTFRVDIKDLFEPPDLLEVTNFRKVVHTLSKLSKTDIALSRIPKGFPPNNSRDEDQDEDIYGNLSNMAIKHDIEDNEELYDSVAQENDDEIYEDIINVKKRRTREPTRSTSVPEPVHLSKREYCIQEMCDTEKNYVDALTMIVTKFIGPLANTITASDKNTIFSSIDKMLEVHKGFYSDLSQACANDKRTTSEKPRIHEVFLKWKPHLLLYGDYCSNLPKAQETIEKLTKTNEAVKLKVEDCERQANDGRFRLRDLLHVPMQRVLKYHLLLRELIKNTDKTSDQQGYLQQALEAMQDLSFYVNEVKRDNEALALIEEIQRSITDLQMPDNTSLRDYGKLQKDGELKVRNHNDHRVRQRYIFLFDKVMLMCKARGDSYSYKEAILLAEYRLDNSAAARDAQRKADKWNCTFQMVKLDDSMAITFLAKTDDLKNKWIDAINLALDNTQPAAGKDWIMTTFTEPKTCDICGKLLRGVFFQGYKNPQNTMCVHKECIGKQKPQTQEVSVQGEKMRATVSYFGNPKPGAGRIVLQFSEGDMIGVTRREGDWLEGVLGNAKGWFPQQLVEPVRPPKRQPSYLDWKLNNQRSPISSSPRTPPPLAASPIQERTVSPNDLSRYDWFVGLMERGKATQLMQTVPDSTYLVRESANSARTGNPALTIKYKGDVRHIKIEYERSNGYYMSDARFFHSLPELIEFYQKNSLADSFQEVNTTLMYPYKTVSKGAGGAPTPYPVPLPPKPHAYVNGTRVLCYAVAMYDYAATATSQISLAANDRVAVLSKCGADKGWWKGEHCSTRKVGYFPFAYVREEDEE